MSAHRLINFCLAALISLVMSSAYLLDGPDDLQAASDTASSIADAQAAAVLAARESNSTLTALALP